MTGRVIRIGVIGLSRGFDLTRPTLLADPRCRVVAAADPRPDARAAFAAEFAGRTYETAAGLLADPEVELVYIATPHESHADLAIATAQSGKHILVEKPMALDLAACRAMQAAAEANSVQIIVGPSHSYDPPVVLAADLIASGRFGRPRMVTAITATDFLYRPRRPEELETARGGGVVFSQAAHQIDVLRRLVPSPVVSVRSSVGVWDGSRPTEGAYQAFLSFEDGASAVLTYSGYGRYDTDALVGWIGETGAARDPDDYAAARRRLSAADERDLKAGRAYGARTAGGAAPLGHEHFGFWLVNCERGDLRLTAGGVETYGPTERATIKAPLDPATRRGVIDEIWSVVAEGRAPLHSAAWGRANLAVSLAILKSAAEGRDVAIGELEDPS